MSENTEVIELTEEIEVVGPGTMLREARLAKGLSQQVVAQRLNLRTFQIEQIESENFSKDMPPTFTRGYLRNYAKLVDVCQEDVLDAYDHLGIAAAHANKMQSFSKQTKKETENRIIMGLTYIILIGLMAMSGVWWYQQDSALEPVGSIQTSSSNEQIVEQQAAEPIEELEPLAASDSSSKSESDTQNPSSDSLTRAQETSPEQLPNISNAESLNADPAAGELATGDGLIEQGTGNASAVATPTVDEATTSEQTGIEQAFAQSLAEDDAEVEIVAVEPVPVSFYFRGDCWVNIFDATGERIAWGVKKADYTMNIKGIPPFKVTLGKPDLVSISFDGIPVDISQFSAGQIAKFELPLEEL